MTKKELLEVWPKHREFVEKMLIGFDNEEINFNCTITTTGEWIIFQGSDFYESPWHIRFQERQFEV